MRNSTYWLLMCLLIGVYLLGLPVTLMENDSAQFAVMAMRMVQENDFLNLIKGTEEYLDKPHLHYWLAALSYKVFGIHDWAYRIPGLLALGLGAYSVFGLAKLFYSRRAGQYASLIFASSQTIVLSGMDVRTDAVLTGFTIFSIWQLSIYLKNSKLSAALWGAFGAAMSFSTKGQIALLVIGISLLCYIAFERKWGKIFHWKVLLGILVFALFITPMLYAYYHQFDLHPEKIIRGKGNRSGIFFIFWEQSFERLSGEGIGKNSSNYFFFFHTYLWVFLPWSVIGILALYHRVKQLVTIKFQKTKGLEFLTTGGIVIIFFIISFAQFKLPHYMNILIPLFAVLSGGWLAQITHNKAQDKFLQGVQWFVLVLAWLVSLALTLWAFPQGWYWAVAASCVMGLTFFIKEDKAASRAVVIGVLGAVGLNMVLNGHFYPQLLKFQGGSNMAAYMNEKGINPDDIYKLSDRYTWSLDFYNYQPAQGVSLEELKDLKTSAQQNKWIYTSEEEMEMLTKNNIDFQVEHSVDQFRITRLQWRFLNPETRASRLNKMYLLKL